MRGGPQDDSLQEALDVIEIENFLDFVGAKYRRTRGQSGPQFNVAECPVCGNTGHKVYLNRETGLGNCFAGGHPPGKAFNKWSFIRAYYDSNAEAVAVIKQLAAEFGWRPRAKVAREEEAAAPLGWEMPVNQALPVGELMPRYLLERNITPELAKAFDLRWCASGYFAYFNDAGKLCHQDYSKRILIPVRDMHGQIVNFQGRDVTGTSPTKYLFPPQLRGTGSLLYNGHRAMGAHTIVLCEGVFDVISAQSAFWSHPASAHISVVGTFGITVGMGAEDSQLSALKGLREAGAAEFVFMWDGEPKAIDRALHYGYELRRRGFDTKIALLPPDTDPNEIPQDKVVEAYWRARSINQDSVTELRLSLGL